jgi:hypothetical protein
MILLPLLLAWLGILVLLIFAAVAWLWLGSKLFGSLFTCGC